MISKETYALVRDEIEAEELEPLTAKGFAEPVTVCGARRSQARVGGTQGFQWERLGMRFSST